MSLQLPRRVCNSRHSDDNSDDNSEDNSEDNSDTNSDNNSEENSDNNSEDNSDSNSEDNNRIVDNVKECLDCLRTFGECFGCGLPLIVCEGRECLKSD